MPPRNIQAVKVGAPVGEHQPGAAVVREQLDLPQRVRQPADRPEALVPRPPARRVAEVEGLPCDGWMSLNVRSALRC